MSSLMVAGGSIGRSLKGFVLSYVQFFHLLQQIVNTTSGPYERIQQLQAERDRIDHEMEQIRQGNFTKPSDTQLKADLPAAVQAALDAGEYKDWRIDDIDHIEREVGKAPDGNYYDFDLESGNKEVDVRIHENGELEVIPD